MELKSISEIINNDFDVEEYVSYLGVNNWNIDRAREVISNARQEWQQVPISDFSFNYLLSYLCRNYNDISWNIASSFCTEDLKALLLHINNTNKVVFLTLQNVTILEDNFRLLDAGIELDTLHLTDLESLIRSTDFNQNSDFLSHLGLIANNDIRDIPEELFIDDSTSRFSSAVWFGKIQTKNVLIAGIGGIGSFASFLISRTHPHQIYVFDPDKIESVNMAGQLFGVSDLDTFKVDSIVYFMANYSNYHSAASLRDRYTEDSPKSKIMICGFDNMEARETFFSNWESLVKNFPEEERKSCLFIDGRLAAEYLQVFCIRGDDSFNMERYKEQYLFSDEEAEETVCSYKQTSYMASMIGSIITNLFVNFVANEVTENLRDLPFLTTYDSGTMTFKTEN